MVLEPLIRQSLGFVQYITCSMRQESDRAMENLFKNYQNTVILNNQISISMNGRVWVMFLFIIMLNFAR
jgi:hypothetical protein